MTDRGIPKYRVFCVREGGVHAAQHRIDSPTPVAEFVREIVGDDEREHLIVFMLDARHNVKGVEIVSIGTLTASLVHPREIFRASVVKGAAAIVLSHTHPSGESAPSQEDRESTRRIKKAGELMGIPLLDHVIVTKTGHFSFREGGLL